MLARRQVETLFPIPAGARGVHDAHEHLLHAEAPLGDLGDDEVRVVAVGRGDEDVGTLDAGLNEGVGLQRRPQRELAVGFLPAVALPRVETLV
jgi:hypothetical protein